VVDIDACGRNIVMKERKKESLRFHYGAFCARDAGYGVRVDVDSFFSYERLDLCHSVAVRLM
jgi:hypothetical protein